MSTIRFDAPDVVRIPAETLCQVRKANDQIDRLLDSALTRSEPVAVDLTEASQALHRAMIALASASMGDRRLT